MDLGKRVQNFTTPKIFFIATGAGAIAINTHSVI
jgi:hypothetical protein